MKVSRKRAKICPNLTKTSKRHDRHCSGIPVDKQTFACGVVVPLIFKNVRKTKVVHNKCKSEKKYQRQSQHPVKDLKMELFTKIVNGFKL